MEVLVVQGRRSGSPSLERGSEKLLCNGEDLRVYNVDGVDAIVEAALLPRADDHHFDVPRVANARQPNVELPMAKDGAGGGEASAGVRGAKGAN